MKSIFHGHGYVMNDNRASGGVIKEDDVINCAHCQKTLHKAKWKEDGGFCSCCDKGICAYCADRMLVYGCEAFARKIDKAVNEHYRLEQNRRILGLD